METVLFSNRENKRLIAEMDELKAGHFRVEGELHPTPCTWGTLCPYCRINELTAERDGYLNGQQQMQDTCNRLQDSIAKYAEERRILKAEVAAHEEYEALLIEEINAFAGVAYVHGFQSENAKRGKACRAKIAALKATKDES